MGFRPGIPTTLRKLDPELAAELDQGAKNLGESLREKEKGVDTRLNATEGWHYLPSSNPVIAFAVVIGFVIVGIFANLEDDTEEED